VVGVKVKLAVERLNWLHHIGALLLFIALATLLLFRQVILGYPLWHGDTFTFFYPTRHYVSKRLLEMQLPLWQPYCNMGITALAEPQYQVFYPPLWLTLPLQAHTAISFSIWLHLILSGYATFLFLRSCLRLSMLPSLFGAFAFMLSGFIQGHIGHLNLVLSYPYLPLGLFVVYRALTFGGNVVAWGIKLGIVFGLQALTGSPFTYYSFVMAVAFTAFLGVQFDVGLKRCFLLWLVSLFVLFVVFAIQLLPTFEVARFSVRIPTKEFASLDSLSPLRWLVTSVLPNSYGTFVSGFFTTRAEAFSFVGHSTMLLAFIGVLACASKEGFSLFFSLFWFLSLILSFGSYTPFWQFLAPVASAFYRFRCPSRWLYTYTLSVCVLSSIGMQRLLCGLPKRKILFAICVVLYAAFLSFVMAMRFMKPSHDVFADLLDMLLVLCLWAYAIMALLWAVMESQETKSPSQFAHRFAHLLLIGMVCELFLLAQGMEFSVGVEKSIFSHRSSVARYIGENERYFSERMPIAHVLLANRYLNHGVCKSKFDALVMAQLELLKPNLNVLQSKRAIYTEGMLISRPYWSEPFVVKTDLMHKDIARLCKLAGVKRIISPWRKKQKHLKLLAETEDGIFVYEDDEALPMVYFVSRARRVRTTDDAIRLVSKPSFDARREVVLVGEVVGEGMRVVGGDGKVAIRRWGYEIFEASCEASCDGWLVWLECFHPGWKAFVDGVRKGVSVANGAFMAVKVGKGKHNVTFVFLPTSYLVGSFISLCAIAFLISLKVYRVASGNRR
jgi:hypothetical protein